MEIMFQLEHRYFCLRAPSEVSFKFDLPDPTINLDTIPLLLGMNGQADISIAMLHFIDVYQTELQMNSSSIFNRFIMNLGK
jgi:hypothetical protein